MLVDAALQCDSAAFGGVRAKSFFLSLSFSLSFSFVLSLSRRLKVRFGLPVASVRAPLWRQWRLGATLGHHALFFGFSSCAPLVVVGARCRGDIREWISDVRLLPVARRVTGEFRVVA